MRHAATLLLVLLAGCMASGPDTSTEQDGLICDPFCDPGDYDYTRTLEGAYDFGLANFPDAVAVNQSCADIGVSVPEWDCVVSLVTTANPCGTIAVECIENKNRPRCNWKALDYCH